MSLHNRYPRGRHLWVAFLIGSLAFLAAFPSAAFAGVPSEPSVARASGQSDLIVAINGYRVANGRQPLAATGTLTNAATWMASDMAGHNYIGHTSSDGRSSVQRMAAFGYPSASTYTGEDLAAGYVDAAAVLAGWQNSPAHNAVLLNPNYNAVGVGLVYNASSTYEWYWAADFGGSGGTITAVATPQATPAQEDTTPQTATRRAVAARSAPLVSSSASDPGPAEETTSPDQEAAATGPSFAERVADRRMNHVLAVLVRMGIL